MASEAEDRAERALVEIIATASRFLYEPDPLLPGSEDDREGAVGSILTMALIETVLQMPKEQRLARATSFAASLIDGVMERRKRPWPQ